MAVTEESLCWKCGNACVNGCSWSESGIPVKGWHAEKNEQTGSYRVYRVVKCPQYRANERLKDIDIDGAHALVTGIVKQAASDYIKGSEEEVIIVERFIRSRRFGSISNVDPDVLLKILRAKRKERIEEMKQKRRKAQEALSGSGMASRALPDK